MRRWLLAVVLALGAACTSQSGASPLATNAPASTPTTASLPATTTSTTAAPAVALPPDVHIEANGRAVFATHYRPFVDAQGVIVNYPTGRVERAGFHESNLAASRPLVPLATAGETFVMPSRDRHTGANTAVDILSDPTGEVRAPVTGTVKRGGTYTLYCKYTDSFLVIEPDSHPGWEVKLLHISGLVVATGQRLVAGETKVAQHPTRLPFVSDVETWSAAPVWTHVHVEVDDPTIKNPPGVGGHGCS